MLLLQIFTKFAFNKVEALTELNFADVNSILSTRRFVFLPLGTIKSNLSEKVLWSQAGFTQNIFLERDLSREDYTENTLYEFNRCCPNKGIKKMKAAALISQSRRWLNRRVKRLL